MVFTNRPQSVFDIRKKTKRKLARDYVLCSDSPNWNWNPKLRTLTPSLSSPSPPSRAWNLSKLNGVLLQSTPRSWRFHHLHGPWQVREWRAHQIRFHRRHMVNPNFNLSFPQFGEYLIRFQKFHVSWRKY